MTLAPRKEKGLSVVEGALGSVWGHLSEMLEEMTALGEGWQGGLESKTLPISQVPGFYQVSPWPKFHSLGE